MRYIGIKSEFIKNLIHGTSWNDRGRRQYVDELIEVERYIVSGPTGFADALNAGRLKAKHSRESMTIFKELKPEEYDRFMRESRQRQKAAREESERRATEQRAKEERLRKEWLAMGGTE